MSIKTSIYIKKLRLRTYIGIEEWEQKKKQDIVINIKLVVSKDILISTQTDNINDTFNYKKLTKEIINYVESNRFLLLEKLTKDILDMSLCDSKVLEALVEVEKPHALRFSDSVSITLSKSK